MADSELNSYTEKELKRYVDILLDRGVARGLIGPRETDRIWDRHIFNSLAVAELVPSGVDVIDVGSGAGLPGMPLALARPDLQICLLEPMLRRATFLDEVVTELGLTERVEVVRGRAEDHQDSYDLVTARALAPLPRLLTWCVPLMRPGGTILALKGASADAELEQASSTIQKGKLRAESLVVRAKPDADPTRVIRVTRSEQRG